MLKLFVVFVISICCVFLVNGLVDRQSHGFGAQRLKKRSGSVQKKIVSETKNSDNGVPTTCEDVYEYRFTEAVIDNFENINKQRTWEGEGQRYWLNKQFWGGNGYPIFVFIGGEGQESCSRLTNRMYVYDLAKEHKALMVNVEHRYYGESYPTTDMSTENLGYLSSQQALADLTRIINHITSSLETTNSRIITVGGSYPGNLAAWFKLKYPQVSSGSIASSAPLNAETNFYQYMEVVANSIAYFSGDECNKALEQAALEVAKFAKEGPNSDGYKKLGTDFATCSPMKNVADLSILLSDLMGNIQGTIQYNNEHNGVMNVTDICAVMTSGTDYYNQFVELSAKFRTANGQACEDASWEDTVAYLSNPEYDPNNAARPWTYQTCNEFGYFQTTDSPKQPFYSWTVLNDNFYRQLCSAAFNGWKSDPEVEWINEVYGSTDIAGTDIIFPSGTIDPWHSLGVTNQTVLPQPTEKSVYILGTAHCNDLYAPASSDPESLTAARQIIAEQVTEWLK